MVTYYKDQYTDIATVQRTKPGNTLCGDGHIVLQADHFTICAVIDGLGSGKGAHHSTEKALQAIREHQHEDVEDILEQCNRYLSNERGAVITLLRIDHKASKLTYSNFGNIGFILYLPDGSVIRPLPKRGYLCGRMQKLSSEQFKYESGSSFVMYSDGVEYIPSKKDLASSSFSISKDFMSRDLYSTKDDATLMIGTLK